MANLDWVTIASLATAGGTMILAIATFGSVRSANRAARVSEQAFLLGQRPLLMPSRLTDTPVKLMWVDDHWGHVEGSRALVERVDDVLYLAMSLRNVGNGTAVLQGWRPIPRIAEVPLEQPDPSDFRPQSRDLYVPAGDVGFWQAAVRDSSDPELAWLQECVSERNLFLVELLYSDHEGSQRAIGLFSVAPPSEGSQWISSVVRHWNLDRPNPR